MARFKKPKAKSEKTKTSKFSFSSWYTILFGTIIVWILSCSQKYCDIFLQKRHLFAVLIIMAYLIVVYYIVFYKKERDTETILGLILFGGFLLRSYYVLAAPYYITIHDIGSFKGLDTSETASGHFGYIDYIYKNRALPDFDPRWRWSFYNPPGFYILGAIVLGISQIFHVPEPMCYETIQVITLCFSNLTVWTGYRILKEFSIKDKWLLLLTTLLSFHPSFAVMAVTLTNDCMAMYFMMLAVWYTIRWQNKPEIRKIIVIALAVGIGMMTKLNTGFLAFAIGTVFIYVFFKNRKEWKKYLVQFLVFALICPPIGLFNPIRNKINYDIPFTYVQQVDRSSTSFMADATPFSMFGFLPPRAQVSYGFVTWDVAQDKNAWIQILKTACFDELTPDLGNSLFGACALVLLWLGILLAILMNGAFIWSICKKQVMKIELKLLCFIAYATMLVSFMSFCMKEPFIFTMEYRYIPISLLFPVISAALWLQNGSDNGLFEKSKYRKFLRNIMVCGTVCFIILAVICQLDLIAWSNTRL